MTGAFHDYCNLTQKNAGDHNRRMQPDHPISPPSRRASRPPGPPATTPSSAPPCRSSARSCARRSISAPARSVLDVAAGNGNATLAAARRWCEVTSTDYVPALLERGRARAAAEGLTVEFQEADAEALPFADGSFDVVVSTFGVMFTPDQDQRRGRAAARVQAAAARSASPTGRPRASSASCSRRSANTCRRRPA